MIGAVRRASALGSKAPGRLDGRAAGAGPVEATRRWRERRRARALEGVAEREGGVGPASGARTSVSSEAASSA